MKIFLNALVALILAFPSVVFSQDDPFAELRQEVAEDAVDPRVEEINESVEKQVISGQGSIHLYQLVEEMTDDLVVDLRDLNLAAVSPVAMRRMGLSPNLSAAFGDFVESTVVSEISNATKLRVKRCVACSSLRSRIEGGDWVVTLGMTQHEDFRREAEALGVKAFLDLRFAFYPGVNIAALNVEVIRAEDGAVMWAETYRSDSSTAAILRSGDRVESRKERLLELERKLDARPYYGHIVYGGGTYIPYDSDAGSISGMAMGYRIYEKFGEDRRWLFGVGAEGFANFSEDNALLGSFVGATLHYQLTEPNLNSVTVRTGPSLYGFFAGTEGNSAALEWGVDAIMQFRLGVGASAFYFVPTEFAGADLGGLGFKGRVTFNW